MNHFIQQDAQQRAHQSVMDGVYRSLFPGSTITRTTDIALDQVGVDLVMANPSLFPRPMNVEEKMRFKKYGVEQRDMLLEVYDDWFAGPRAGQRTVGWTTDETKITDLVAYVFTVSQVLYLVHYKPLREFARFIAATRRALPAPNKTHTTYNIPVTWKDLTKAGIPVLRRPYGLS